MANTYSQIFIHVIICVQDRDRRITPELNPLICKYITGIVSHRGSKVISIYAMPDHLHILISLNPDEALSELVKEIKRSSTLYLNDNNQLPRRFQWQAGYAAFSYSRSMIKIVSKYIENQEKHHKVKTFREEYIEFLEKFGVEYDLKYIFTES